MQIRRNRTHATEQHRGIQIRIDPGHSFDVAVSQHADDQRSTNEQHRGSEVPREAPDELRPRR
jgi:hypothetical protein